MELRAELLMTLLTPLEDLVVVAVVTVTASSLVEVEVDGTVVDVKSNTPVTMAVKVEDLETMELIQ